MSKRMGSRARKARKAAIEARAALMPVLQVVDRRGCVVRVEAKPVRLPDFKVTSARDKKTGLLIVKAVKPAKPANLGLQSSSAMHHKAIEGRTYHATAWNAPSGVGRGGSAKVPTKGRWSRD